MPNVLDDGMSPPLRSHVLQVISQVIHFHATPLAPPGLCDVSVEPVASHTYLRHTRPIAAPFCLGLRLGECWSAGCNMRRLEVRARGPGLSTFRSWRRLSAGCDGWVTE